MKNRLTYKILINQSSLPLDSKKLANGQKLVELGSIEILGDSPIFLFVMCPLGTRQN